MKAPASTLRRFRPADRSQVLRLVERILREHGLWREHKEFLEDLQDIPRFYLRPGGEFLVLDRAGQVIGCGGVLPRRSKGGVLQRMYLEKPWRGKGLGVALLKRLEASARRRGLRRLRLETAPRLKAAIRLYRRSGYRVLRDDMPSCCSLVMGKRIG